MGINFKGNDYIRNSFKKSLEKGRLKIEEAKVPIIPDINQDKTILDLDISDTARSIQQDIYKTIDISLGEFITHLTGIPRSTLNILVKNNQLTLKGDLMVYSTFTPFPDEKSLHYYYNKHAILSCTYNSSGWVKLVESWKDKL